MACDEDAVSAALDRACATQAESYDSFVKSLPHLSLPAGHVAGAPLDMRPGGPGAARGAPAGGLPDPSEAMVAAYERAGEEEEAAAAAAAARLAAAGVMVDAAEVAAPAPAPQPREEPFELDLPDGVTGGTAANLSTSPRGPHLDNFVDDEGGDEGGGVPVEEADWVDLGAAGALPGGLPPPPGPAEHAAAVRRLLESGEPEDYAAGGGGAYDGYDGGSGGGGGGGGDDDFPSEPGVPNALGPWVKRKAARLEQRMRELGEEGVEREMQGAQQARRPDPHGLLVTMEACAQMLRPAVVAEVHRGLLDDPGPEAMGRLAQELVRAGADAVAVYVDGDEYDADPEDLPAVCKAVGRDVPVLVRDLVLHPLQLVDAARAGAAGVSLVNCVSGAGLPIMVQFGAALGLDTPVEVVNLEELRAAERTGAPLFALNLNVGIQLPIAGFQEQTTQAMLDEMPQGSGCMCGVRSVAEARAMHAAGARAILVKRDAYILAESPAAVVSEVAYAVSGDD